MGKSIATTVELRKKNRRELLSMLLSNGETTRNSLRNDSGFSYTTIGNLLGDLQNENFIIQQGEAESTGGRKAQVIKVNPDRAYFISIDISGKLLKCGIYNLECTNCYYGSHDYIEEISFKENFEMLLESIYNKCQEINILDKLECIGIVIPGNYNEKRDIITDTYDEELGTFNLKLTISKVLDLPVVIKNDAKTAAYSELKNLENPDKSQLFYFLVLKDSFGAAIVINGEIYQGATGFAGEIYALPQTYKDKNTNLGELLYPSDDLKYISKALGEDVSEQKFFELFKDKNPVATELFNKTVDAFVSSIAAISCILNPSDIRIGGYYNAYGIELIREIELRLTKICEEWQYENLSLELSDFSQYTLVDSIDTQMLNEWVNSLWS